MRKTKTRERTPEEVLARRHIWEPGSTHRSVAGEEYDEMADALAAGLRDIYELRRCIVAAIMVYVEVVNGRKPNPVDFELFLTVGNRVRGEEIDRAPVHSPEEDDE